MSKENYQILELKLPTDYDEEMLRLSISKTLSITDFSYTLERKSLDARKKSFIHYLLRIGVYSPELKAGEIPQVNKLEIPYQKRNKKVIVVGSGPAGFFAGYVLSLAGFTVTLLEQGKVAEDRVLDIKHFEATGQLIENSNYAYGEGGAGTFSDGKLTSRTKTIELEKKFIFDTFIKAGAPLEIAYLSSPHIGSDNLQRMMVLLRKMFTDSGAQIIFGEKVNRIRVRDNHIQSIGSTNNEYSADYFFFAPGHSSYETYRMLINNNVLFQPKTFAVGTRVEHLQELINQSQWNSPRLNGVKAAEYKLTFAGDNLLPSYSFCMCPGGRVVPASAVNGMSVVNGVSNYQRNSRFANSAIVASFHLGQIMNREVTAMEALSFVENLEKKTFALKNSFAIPANTIEYFLKNKTNALLPASSYPFELFPYDFRQLFPKPIFASLQAGMKEFCKKIRGFEQGIMLGLETKTSSPVQAVRSIDGKCADFDNLYVIGEGSGWAGGIVSSGADGVKNAIKLMAQD
jgi:hypothetical protein